MVDGKHYTGSPDFAQSDPTNYTFKSNHIISEKVASRKNTANA
jgi:hypothetical protein